MIDTLFLANQIERKLNQNELGIKFLIFADEGDLRKSTQKGIMVDKYTQGLLEITSSDIIPIKNISYQTFNMQLMVLVDLFDLGQLKEGQFKREQSRNLILVKNILNQFIEELNGRSVEIREDDKTYISTYTMSRLTDGQKMSFGEMADCLPIYLQISVNLFQNGVYSNDCKLLINGEDVYFTEMNISKIRTADQNEFASENGAKTLALIGGKSVDFIMPCATTTLNKTIMKDILGNTNNNAVAVEIETPIGRNGFIGIFGNNTAKMTAGLNASMSVSLVEGKANLLKYDYRWSSEEFEGTDYSTPFLGGRVYFWGDGTITKTYIQIHGEPTEHTYTDGKPKHTIRIYNYNAIVIS